jgi:predicted Holliday junction resolvase-like endonuclease
MSESVSNLIAQLKSDDRFVGTCPNPKCGEEFRLSEANLFAADEPATPETLGALRLAFQYLSHREEALEKERNDIVNKSLVGAKTGGLGKRLEQICPSFPDFPFDLGDCRALFEPIDYLVFSGLAKNNHVDALTFVEVKSGDAKLTGDQPSIKKAIEKRAVRFHRV